MKRVEVSPGEFVEVSDEMMERAKQAMARAIANTPSLFDRDFPEPECSICGRIIYCGASSLCNRVPCGLQSS